MKDKTANKLTWKPRDYFWDEARLRAIGQRRKPRVPGQPVGRLVDLLWKKKIVPLQKKYGWLAQAWEQLLPEEVRRHSCLESFQRGSLRVLVDSDAHFYELNLMLREGLVDQIRQLCPKVSLREIRLARGDWYRLDEEGNRRVSLTGETPPV